MPKTKMKDETGLCSSCKNSENCSLPLNNGQVIVHCNEFENPPTPPSSDRTRSRNPGKIRAQGNDRANGLCWDCENRSECNFAKPDGGVWHCQEYR